MPTIDGAVVPKDSVGSSGNGLRYTSIACIYVFAGLSPLSITLGQLAQFGMLIITVIVVVSHWRGVIRSPVFWIAVAFVAYVVLRGFSAAFFEQPSLSSAHLDETGNWFRILALPILILAMALVATGDWMRHAVWALVATALGFLLFEVLPTWSWEDFFQALTGTSRYIFGMGHSRSALALGAMLIGLLMFVPALLLGSGSSQRSPETRMVVLRASGIALLAALLLMAVFVTKSRTGWLSLIVALSVVAIVLVWYFHRELRRPSVLGGLLVVTGLIASGVHFAWDEVERRTMERADAIGQILAMKSLQDAWEFEDPNVGARGAYKVFAMQLWLDRPLTGWGPADPYHMMDERPLPPVLEGRSGHFHDAHVELLSRFGGIGYALMIALFVAIIWEAIRQIRSRSRTDRVGLGLAFTTIGFVPFMLVAMLGTYFLDSFKQIHLYTMFLAPMAAAALARHINAPPADR
ncbi:MULTISPECIES: O-antigen ligase [unclassified Thioalkalivibrio]|uniref:O-antigen ligase family protein n=1 Tax=unclassified Thioalkalivibrio TaxID=2621013 RepID=UPI00036CF359|nr:MULTISPECIES: O-antigen ligase family protein [unclassified Thioalkalivibrio]